MKLFRIVILLMCVALTLAGCSKDNEYASDEELYEAGLDLINVMEEMIQSEEYGEIYSSPSSLSSLIEDVDTGDYDSPTAVYRILPPSTSEILEISGISNNELWNSLSRNLKNQLKNKISFSTVVTFINGQKGSSTLAFSSIYTAFEKTEDFKVERETIYLFTFEEGIPIAVIFSEGGGLSGQFVFLDDTDRSSSVKSFFKELGCSVKKLDVN